MLGRSQGGEAKSEGESERSDSLDQFRRLDPAFARRSEQLWRLSLVVNSFRFNEPPRSLCFTGGANRCLITVWVMYRV